jgi:small subunit ribosomal protein S21
LGDIKTTMKRFKNENHRVNGLKVEVKHDNVERALKKLRKKVDDDGRIKEYRDRQEFQKPSVKKKIEKKRAIKRHEKKLRDERKKLLDFE